MSRIAVTLVLIASTTVLAGPLPTATDLLSRYVRIDTSNPPGVTEEAAEFWQRFFAAEGIETKRIVLGEEKPALLARIGEGQGPALVLMHHMDVVPADPDEWDVPPFAGEIRDGVLYGRGVIDTKSLGVFQALAMARLVREQAPIRREILFLGMPDEEVGATEGAIPFVENHWDEVANAEFLFNEGGTGTIGILAPETPVMNVQVAEKQVLWLDVTVRGKSGHGSMPHDEQAVARLARALRRIDEWETPQRISPVVAETQRRIARLHEWPDRMFLAHPQGFWASPFVLGRMEEDPTTNALVRNTCSLTGLQAGTKINVLPSVARATIDCRLLPGESTDVFLESLKDVIDDENVEFRVRHALENDEPSSWENEAFEAIETVVTSHLDDVVVTPSMSAGFTDSTHFRLKGLPCYGFNPLVLRSEQLQSIHNVNERVGIENLERADRIYTDVVRRLAKSGKLHW